MNSKWTQEEQKELSLSAQEKRLITQSTFISGAILALVAFTAIFLLCFLQYGNIVTVIFDLTWLSFITERCFLVEYWYLYPILFIVFFAALMKLYEYFVPGYKQMVINLRQGLNGELIRMPSWYYFFSMGFTNFFEELLFRGALISLLQVIFDTFLDPLLSTVLALVLSSILFWFVHVDYHTIQAALITIPMAVVLGLIYLYTGSLLVVFITHFTYNLTVMYLERFSLCRDRNYFHGEIPSTILIDMQASEAASRDSKDSRF